MKETTKKNSLELPREVLKASGLANGQELGALSLDGVVLLTRDSMPIVELLQMLDTLHRYAAAMLTQIAVECGPCEKADESLTAEDVLEECEVTIPSWVREQAGIPENAKLACYVRDGVIYVGEDDEDVPDMRDVPYYVLEFFAENIMDGWKVYAMQNVADAAKEAYQEAEMSEDARWHVFLELLDGRELTTPSRLTARNFYFEDNIEAMDDRILNFYVVPCFNVDEVFGTFVETDENDHALNIYANYDMQRQQVCDELEITLYGSGIDDQSLTYHLNAAEKEVLREKMEAYCMQREHKPLEQLCQEILQEQDAPTQEMQL